MTPELHINDRVRLMHDIPTKLLHRGEIGVVRSFWFSPTTAYEVEFDSPDSEFPSRALLEDEQLESVGAGGFYLH
jgi:hypothetical protein